MATIATAQMVQDKLYEAAHLRNKASIMEIFGHVEDAKRLRAQAEEHEREARRTAKLLEGAP